MKRYLLKIIIITLNSEWVVACVTIVPECCGGGAGGVDGVREEGSG